MFIIIETLANQFFVVAPSEGIDHCWSGTPVKKVAGHRNVWEAKKNGRTQLVRKIGTRVIEGARYLPAA